MYCNFTNLKKTRALFTALCGVLVFTGTVRAQVNVTATAGTMGPTNYATLNAAFAAINAGTHQGAIAIAITANTSEPATPTPLLASAGTSSYTSISIKPSGGNFIINSAAAPSANRGIIELAGADNVTIDGDDPATPGTQNLSVISASVSTAGIACIRLSSNSATGLDGANNNTVKNCILVGARNDVTGTTSSYGIQFSDGTSASSSGTGAYSSLNTVIQNNTITRCYYGIYAAGNSATYLNTGTQIIKNTIGSATATDYVAFSGIYVTYSSSTAGATSVLISENDVRTGFSSATANMAAVQLDAANAGAIVTRNNIHDCINPASGVWGMYGIQISSSTSNAGITITNNMIRDIAGYPVSSLGNQYGGIGIFVTAAATGIKINNNTIAQLKAGVIGSCVHISDGSATVSQFQNNILVNNVNSPYSCGFYTSATGNISGGTVNNNNYFVHSSGVFGYYNSANRTSLAAWRTATSKDANSLNLLPNFVSTTDLHIVPAQITYLESGGASVASTGVSVDFDNDSRPGPAGSVNGGGTAPDIGADEFDGIIPPLPPAVNSSSVAPSGNQCVAVSHNITASVTPGATPLTSVYIAYSFNGVAQPTVAMTGGSPTAASNWSGTIPPATPGNATVTWTVMAADVSYTVNLAGTSYQDEPTTGASASATVIPSPVCAGSTATLSLDVAKPGVSGAVGTGTATISSDYPNPIYSNWANNKTQILYLASELQAAGFRAGNLSSMSLNLTSTSTTVRSGFTINMAQTAATALTTTFLTPTFTQVYTNATYAPAVGINAFAFGTGAGSSATFNWDGVSNLVIQICWDNVSSTATTASSCTADNTTFNSVVAYNRTSTTGTVICGLTNTGTTYTRRPNITFTGTRLTTVSSYTWTDGVTNLVSASPSQTVVLNTTTNYTATASVSGCPISATVQAVVTPTIAAPTSTNSTQCGLGVPTAMVGGGTSYKWYASPTSTTVLQSGASQTYTGTISSTTNFYVATVVGVCEGVRGMVTASVTAPDPVTATASSASLCPGATMTLTAVKSGTTSTYSYTWTASPATGSGMASAVTGSVVPVTPTTAGTYVYSVLASDGVCTTSSSVSVMLSNAPVVTASVTPLTVCSGSSVTLNATTNAIAAGTVAIGTATTLTAGNTTEPTAFCNRYTGYRMQAVYTAAELTAAGLRAGNITSIAYNITTIGSSSVNPLYTVKCGTTTVSAFTNFVSNASFTTVYPATTYTHAVGVNVIPFSTPYNWDGVSNLVVEVTHDGVDASTSSQTYYTATAGNTIVYSNYNNATGNPGTMRLNIIFGGQRTSQGAGSLAWQWNPGAINSNTASVAPINTGTNAATSSYTVTGTDPVTTCSSSAVVSVTVNPVPAAPTATNSAQCGVGTPTASVAGGTNYRWYATPTSTAVLQSGASATYTSVIGSTTTWYVSSYNGSCESTRTAITASVSIPDAITASSTATAICPGQSFTLTATKTGTNNVYSYTWTATPATGSGIATSVTGATTAVTPVTPGTYNYKVTGADAVCTTTAAVSVMLSLPPQITALSNPTTACLGSSVTLSGVSGTVASGTVGIGVSTVTLTSADYTLGANPFNNWFGGQKDQYIFTSAELTAAGLTAGNITALSFDVVSATALTMANFSMTIGHTTQSVATPTSITTGLNPAYFNASQGVTAGLNNYVFSTPFNWNGTDNVVVSVSWSNVNSGGTSLTPSIRAHTASFVASTFLYADNTPASALAAASHSTSAGIGATARNEATALRPNIVFTGQRLTQGAGGLVWQWNPGAVNSNTMTVTPPTTGTSSYTVTATDPATTCSNTAVVTLTVNPIPSVTVAASTGSICSGTTASLTATGATTYSWMPAGGTSSVAAVSPTTSTIYTVTGTSLGCSNTQTVNLNVTPTPTVTASASPTVICAGATVSLTASGATTYSWMPNSSTSGTTTATPTVSTTYTVSGTTAGCTNTRTLNVTVNNVPTLTVTANPASGVLCTTGATATLTAAGTSTAYVWGHGPTTASTSVAPSATTVYSVTGTNSCGVKTVTTSITVATTPTITATPVSTLICVNNPAVLNASATAGVTYSWSTGSSATSVTVTPNQTTTYTVTATNACGTATATVVQNVSPCVGIEEIANAGDISIYPNPANDYVSISVPATVASANTKLEVTDALGKLVIEETISREVTTLRLTGLKDGVYFFKVITNNQPVKVGKVVKH